MDDLKSLKRSGLKCEFLVWRAPNETNTGPTPSSRESTDLTALRITAMKRRVCAINCGWRIRSSPQASRNGKSCFTDGSLLKMHKKICLPMCDISISWWIHVVWMRYRCSGDRRLVDSEAPNSTVLLMGTPIPCSKGVVRRVGKGVSVSLPVDVEHPILNESNLAPEGIVVGKFTSWRRITPRFARRLLLITHTRTHICRFN